MSQYNRRRNSNNYYRDDGFTPVSYKKNRRSNKKQKRREDNGSYNKKGYAVEENFLKKEVYFFLDGSHGYPKKKTLDNIQRFLEKHPDVLSELFYQVTKRIGEPYRDQEDSTRILIILLDNDLCPKASDKSKGHKYTPFMALAWWKDTDKKRFDYIITLLHNKNFNIFLQNIKGEDTLGSLNTALKEKHINPQTYKYRYQKLLGIHVDQVKHMVDYICLDISCKKPGKARLRHCLIMYPDETIGCMYNNIKRKIIKKEYRVASKYLRELNMACSVIDNKKAGNLELFFKVASYNMTLPYEEYANKIQDICDVKLYPNMNNYQYDELVDMIDERMRSMLTEEQVVEITKKVCVMISKMFRTNNNENKNDIITRLSECIIFHPNICFQEIAKKFVSTNLPTKIGYDNVTFQNVAILSDVFDAITTPNTDLQEKIDINNFKVFTKDEYADMFYDSVLKVDTSNKIDEHRIKCAELSVFMILGALAKQGVSVAKYETVINHICNKRSDIIPLINERSDSVLVDYLLRMVTQAQVYPKNFDNMLAFIRHNFDIGMKQKFNIDDLFALRYGKGVSCKDLVSNPDNIECPSYIQYYKKQQQHSNNNNN